MNVPDNTDWRTLPGIILYLLCANYMGSAVSLSMYNKAKEEYPEYFVEELEHERKWALVPDEIKEAHSNECANATIQIYQECYDLNDRKGSGFLYWISHPEEMGAFSNCLASKREEITAMEKAMHEKYLAAYGIKFNK